MPTNVLFLLGSGLVCWALSEAQYALVRVALLVGVWMMWMYMPAWLG